MKFRQCLILMFTLVFLIQICTLAMGNEDVISQIEKLPVSEEPLTMEKILADKTLMPETERINDGAIVETTDRKIEIDKFEASKDDTVNLYLTSTDTVSNLCFKFPVNTKYIEITTIKVNVPLWMDTNLKDYEVKYDNQICYEGIELKTDNVYYEAAYYPVQGMPEKIKYDIDADGLILDPYLIGELATSNNLVLRLPFDNNSSNVWAAQLNSLSSGATRTILDNSDDVTFSYDAGWASPLYAADNNYGTGAVAPMNSPSNLYYDVNKTANGTGMYWEIYAYIGYTTHYAPKTIFQNFTVTNNCYNYRSGYVSFLVIGEYTPDYSESRLDLYCFDGSWVKIWGEPYNLGRTNSVAVYDSKFYETNQSNYTAYSYPTVKTQYYNTNGLVWSNSFGFWGNDSVNGLKNEVNTSQTATAVGTPIFNDSGVNFNTSNYLIFGINNSLINQTEFTFHIGNIYDIADSGAGNVFLNSLSIDKNSTRAYFPDNTQIVFNCANRSGITKFISIASHNINTYETWDFVVNSTNLILYKDGIYVHNVLREGAMCGNSEQFMLGTYAGSTTSAFNGSIKNIRYYNRSLSAEEIYIMYKGGNFTTNKLGEANSSIYLNGNEAINVQNNTLGGITAYSTSQWIKAENGYRIWNTLSQFLAYTYYYDTAKQVSFPSTSFNNWYNIITTTNGSTSKVYLNGILQNTSDGTLTALSSTKFGIGHDTSFSSMYKGTLDEFMFFNYELGQTEITKLYNGYSTNDVDDCSSYNNTLINLNVFNENNPAEAINVNTTFDVFMDYYFYNDTTTKYNFSHRYTASSTNFSICFANLIDNSLNYNLYSQYTTEGGFTHRYYLYNQTYNNQTVFANVGNYISQDNVSRLNLVVRSIDKYEPITNIIGKLQRFYVQDGTWRNVQMDTSADYGLLIYNVREADTDYRIVFTDTNNNIYKTTNNMRFSCQYGICDLTYILDTNLIPTAPNVIISSDYNNVTKILTVYWNDTNALTSNFHLIVKKQLYNGTIVICNSNTSAVSGSLTCDLTNYNGTIFVNAYSSASPETIKLSFYLDIVDTAKKLFNYIGNRDGAFYSFGISLVCMTAGLFSPIVAIILGILSIFLSTLMGLNIIFTTSSILIMCIIGIIIGIKVRS